MTSMDVVSLSRLQFGLTALYHFLFVPLTLGLAVLLGIMESVYVMTGRTIWLQMTKFWGLLFGINFAMGVATGITMEFQFGMNWAYYSHYVGDIFGAPLAIEGLMAFFLEATFIGLFFFGWDKLTRLQHLCVTWLVALGSNLSALWILIANGWMQYPVGAKFNPDTMRMEVTSFAEVLFNPVAQAKFVHTVSAGYVTGAMFVLSVSAFYLLRGRHTELAGRSMTVAASFGLAAALSVVVLGDESGYTAGENQKMKIAAIEAMWDTEPAPASFTVFGLPDLANRHTDYEVKVPWMLGLIATRSIDKTLPGIKELVSRAEQRIRSGLAAYDALEKLRARPANAVSPNGQRSMPPPRPRLRAAAEENPTRHRQRDTRGNLAGGLEHRAGCFAAVLELPPHGRTGFLLHRAVHGRLRARQQAATDEISRLSVGRAAQPAAAVDCRRTRLDRRRSRPAALGHRRRAADVLAVSSLTATNVWITLIGFVVFYSSLAVVDVFLMVRTIRSGPRGRKQRRPPPPAVGDLARRRIRRSTMFDYEIMRLIWWALLGVLLIGFAVFDGFDLGAAALLPYLARNDVERRIVINTIGPVWEGNQVWLILGGGAIFAAWPMLYATAFSGFYLAMFLVLVALILRPVAIKFRSKLENRNWRAVWDAAICVSGLVPALIFGVAFGNVIVGVPFRFDDTLRMTYEGGLFGLLNPFALLCGLVSVGMLTLQGAGYVAVKAAGPVADRAVRIAPWLAGATIALFVVAGLIVARGIDGYVITSHDRA